MTRIFFITDVHASDRCFRKFLNAAKFYKAGCLILGGDITGKVLVPFVERGDGSYDARIFGRDTVVSTEGLEKARKQLQDAGQYSFVASKGELEEIRADKAKEERVFNEAMLGVLVGWLRLAEDRLKGTDVRCYISPGNDDKFEIDDALKDSEHIKNPENKVVELEGGYEMITLGFANPTPWKSPREVSEEKLNDMIEALAGQVKRPSTALYNLHVPPIDTEIDKAPAVSADFEYIREGLGIKMIHAGSSAVRSSIQAHQPLLGLHGHIHESKGFVKIGRTTCLNPGSEYADGVLRGCLVNLQGDKAKEFLLTSG